MLILSTSEGWKNESTWQLPSDFDTGPLEWESSALTTRLVLHKLDYHKVNNDSNMDTVERLKSPQ